MSIILLCATADEAAHYPGFECAQVSNFRAFEGLRITAAFATRNAQEMPECRDALSIVRASASKMAGYYFTAPPEVVIVGGDLPDDIERVA